MVVKIKFTDKYGEHMISNMAKLLKYENNAVMDSGFLVLRDTFRNPH